MQRSFDDGSDDDKPYIGEIEDDDISTRHSKLLIESETKSSVAISTAVKLDMPKTTKPYLVRSRSPINMKKESRQRVADKEEEKVNSRVKPPTAARKRRNSGDGLNSASKTKEKE